MQLSKDQHDILLAIESNHALTGHFDVLCIALEAALDETTVDPEKTDPFGNVAVTAAKTAPTELDVAAVAIAAAWLGTVAQAIEVEDGSLSRASFDDDGIPAFVDTRPIFETARECGFTEGHARLAFRQTRGARTALGRAMKIMAGLGKLRPSKRREHLRGRSRIVPLADNLARNLDRDEIARAKAGSLVYSLIARKDGYEAVRVRKTKSRQTLDAAGAPVDVIGEPDADVMDGFSVPLVPCEELHGIALDHFVQFLDEENDRKPRNTYQRLVHRAVAA